MDTVILDKVNENAPTKTRGRKLSNVHTGTGRAYGNAGVYGMFTEEGGETSCLPIVYQSISTVSVRVRASKETRVRAQDTALAGASRHATGFLDDYILANEEETGALEVVVKHRSMLYKSWGYDSKVADAIAAYAALMDALSLQYTPERASLAVSNILGPVVGTHGGAYEQTHLLNTKDGSVAKRFKHVDRVAYLSGYSKQDSSVDLKPLNFSEIPDKDHLTLDDLITVSNNFCEENLALLNDDFQKLIKGEGKEIFNLFNAPEPDGYALNETGERIILLYGDEMLSSANGTAKLNAGRKALKTFLGDDFRIDGSKTHLSVRKDSLL